MKSLIQYIVVTAALVAGAGCEDMLQTNDRRLPGAAARGKFSEPENVMADAGSRGY